MTNGRAVCNSGVAGVGTLHGRRLGSEGINLNFILRKRKINSTDPLCSRVGPTTGEEVVQARIREVRADSTKEAMAEDAISMVRYFQFNDRLFIA